jgi:hypothetical protein
MNFCFSGMSFHYFANLNHQKRKQNSGNDSCSYLDAPAPKGYKVLNKVLRRFASQDISGLSVKQIGTQLFKDLEKKIVGGTEQ